MITSWELLNSVFDHVPILHFSRSLEAVGPIISVMGAGLSEGPRSRTCFERIWKRRPTAVSVTGCGGQSGSHSPRRQQAARHPGWEGGRRGRLCFLLRSWQQRQVWEEEWELTQRHWRFTGGSLVTSLQNWLLTHMMCFHTELGRPLWLPEVLSIRNGSDDGQMQDRWGEAGWGHFRLCHVSEVWINQKFLENNFWL